MLSEKQERRRALVQMLVLICAAIGVALNGANAALQLTEREPLLGLIGIPFALAIFAGAVWLYATRPKLTPFPDDDEIPY